MAKKKSTLKDPRTTNESCWKAINDNLLPNPPFDAQHEPDKHYEKQIASKKYDTKVIMAHEFRENPEGFKAIAQAVADSYNEANSLQVGGELPEVLDEKTEWVFDPLTGYKEKEKE